MADDAVVERRRALLEAAPALLRGEFRLFFVGGTACAVIALLLWLRAFAGVAELWTAFDPPACHRHELMFGRVGAIVVRSLMAAFRRHTREYTLRAHLPRRLRTTEAHFPGP